VLIVLVKVVWIQWDGEFFSGDEKAKLRKLGLDGVLGSDGQSAATSGRARQERSQLG
jgi:hypothetical protein